MDITQHELGDGLAILRLVGKVNMVSAPLLRHCISTAVAEGWTRLAVDLSRVDFLDSSGLGALINGLKTARLAGGDLRISGPNEQVRLVLQLTNLDGLLIIVDRAETAFADG
ncbi:MAG: STAS domain-containing protein [Salinibacterium sp.]|nr:STAS domain-containing protein [Salinibacterium sp.]